MPFYMSDTIRIIDSEVLHPVVTIAIPTFRRGKLLQEAVDSALHQSFDQEFEVIVVDNNPERNDLTEKTMHVYRNNPQVAYYKNEVNLGPTGNWNRLYDLAKGDYVVMLHDDDLLFPFYLLIVFSLLKKTRYKYELVIPSYHMASTRILPKLKLPLWTKYREIKIQDYLVTQWGLPTGICLKKNKMSKIGGYKDDFYPINDQDFIYRALHIVKGCQVLQPIAFYYMGENTSMQPEIIIKSIIGAKAFNNKIYADKDNPFHQLAPLFYRNQIRQQVAWGRVFVSEEVIIQAKKLIEYRDNWIKDNISRVLSLLFKVYLRCTRVGYFKIKSV